MGSHRALAPTPRAPPMKLGSPPSDLGQPCRPRHSGFPAPNLTLQIIKLPLAPLSLHTVPGPNSPLPEPLLVQSHRPECQSSRFGSTFRAVTQCQLFQGAPICASVAP